MEVTESLGREPVTKKEHGKNKKESEKNGDIHKTVKKISEW